MTEQQSKLLGLKTSGYFMIMAGLLLLTRLIPIFANLPDGFTEFPPATPQDMAILAAHNPAGYQLSHFMALLALPLMWIGLFSHYQRYLKKGMVRRAIIGMVGLTVGMLLFSIALLIDGYMVPLISTEYMMPSLLTKQTALFLVTYSHQFALTFFNPSALFFAIGFGFMASPMAHGQIHNKWFGYVGMALASIVVSSHFFGWKLQGMPLGATVMMVFFLWIFLLGFSSLRADKRESKLI